MIDAPALIHACDMPSLPLPALADDDDSWVGRLAHPLRHEQELFLDVPSGQAMDEMEIRIADWYRRPDARYIERDLPWFVRLPRARWREYAGSAVESDRSLLDTMLAVLDGLDVIVLVEAPLEVVATYTETIPIPTPPEAAREKLMMRVYPAGAWREARAEEPRVHHTLEVEDKGKRLVRSVWPLKPGDWGGAMRWLHQNLNREVTIELMSDGTRRVMDAPGDSR